MKEPGYIVYNTCTYASPAWGGRAWDGQAEIPCFRITWQWLVLEYTLLTTETDRKVIFNALELFYQFFIFFSVAPTWATSGKYLVAR